MSSSLLFAAGSKGSAEARHRECLCLVALVVAIGRSQATRTGAALRLRAPFSLISGLCGAFAPVRSPRLSWAMVSSRDPQAQSISADGLPVKVRLRRSRRGRPGKRFSGLDHPEIAPPAGAGVPPPRSSDVRARSIVVIGHISRELRSWCLTQRPLTTAGDWQSGTVQGCLMP
jgi:hypothetical protein